MYDYMNIHSKLCTNREAGWVFFLSFFFHFGTQGKRREIINVQVLYNRIDETLTSEYPKITTVAMLLT